MIHAATVNENPNGRMHRSTDTRYQLVRDEIDARWNDRRHPADQL